MTPEDVNWRFLVPLLDLSLPVFKSLITAINHSNKSPRSRMQRFVNYVRDTCDVIETTNHTDSDSLSYRLQWNEFYLRLWLWKTYCQVSIYFPKKIFPNYELSYSHLSWRGFDRIAKEDFHAFHGNGDYAGIALHEADYFDLFYQLTSENPT